MPKLILTKTTLLKQRDVNKDQLKPGESLLLGSPKEPQSFELKAFGQAGGHVRMTFSDPIPGTKFNTWLMYSGDGVIESGKGDRVSPPQPSIHLSVPFFAQYAIPAEPTRKTRWEQGRTCFTSSCAMTARFLGGRISGDDDYFYNWIVPTGLDTTEPEAHTRALAKLGFRTEHRTDMTFADLDLQLEKGFPVPIGILHHGSLEHPEGGGHWICVIGRSFGSNGQILYECNDPAGELNIFNGGYQGAVENGDRVIYSKRTLMARWQVEGEGSGWGRIFSNRLN